MNDVPEVFLAILQFREHKMKEGRCYMRAAIPEFFLGNNERCSEKHL